MPQHNKGHKPTGNIILKSEKLKAVPLRSERRQRCSFLLLLFNVFLEVLAIEGNREGKKIKWIQIWKQVKLSMFAGDVILYIENPKALPENY